MIHIASIHWGISAFQDIQFEFVQKNINEFSMWCFLDEIPIENKENSKRYRFYQDSGISNHLMKLDMLASKICCNSDDEDILMFLDGDCWPVCPLDNFITSSLKSFPVVAVVRTENGEPYPHPSFFFTKVKYWKENKLGWSGRKLNGKKFSINYIKNYMESKGQKWLPLKRTNGLSEHKVFFSFYGKGPKSIVYHHGAGFRKPISGFCLKNGINITKEQSIKMIDLFLDWSKNA